MIDHTGLVVSNFAKSKAFYTEALGSIGYSLLAEFPASANSPDIGGFGEPPEPDFWIVSGKPNEPRIHVAFRVETRAKVRDFHEAALAAGGTDNGTPGIREHYHANYYAAFVLDPDGHNIEAVCHSPE